MASAFELDRMEVASSRQDRLPTLSIAKTSELSLLVIILSYDMVSYHMGAASADGHQCTFVSNWSLSNQLLYATLVKGSNLTLLSYM